MNCRFISLWTICPNLSRVNKGVTNITRQMVKSSPNLWYKQTHLQSSWTFNYWTFNYLSVFSQDVAIVRIAPPCRQMSIASTLPRSTPLCAYLPCVRVTYLTVTNRTNRANRTPRRSPKSNFLPFSCIFALWVERTPRDCPIGWLSNFIGAFSLVADCYPRKFQVLSCFSCEPLAIAPTSSG